MQKAAVGTHAGPPSFKTDLAISQLHSVWFFYFCREIDYMATKIHVISSTSVFPYLKEHGTETYVVEILVLLKEKREDFFDFFDFRNARISPKDNDGCAMSPQAFTGNEESSLNFRKKNQTTPPCLAGSSLRHLQATLQ